jgi:AbrB family looped-hinge helix DNA binding protein
METPEGKMFYGTVTVSQRGQIAIPAQARKDFEIKTGDKLLVFGDFERGLGLATFKLMQKSMAATTDLFTEIDRTFKQKDKEEK